MYFKGRSVAFCTLYVQTLFSRYLQSSFDFVSFNFTSKLGQFVTSGINISVASSHFGFGPNVTDLLLKLSLPNLNLR